MKWLKIGEDLSVNLERCDAITTEEHPHTVIFHFTDDSFCKYFSSIEDRNNYYSSLIEIISEEKNYTSRCC